MVDNAKKDNRTPLLNPKVMDGPVIRSTVADIFLSNPKLYLSYHVMSAGWQIVGPVGVLVGGGIYAIGYRPYTNVYQMMGTASLITGSMGIIMGGMGLRGKAMKGELATPIPYNTDGIQQRVDGLRHNYKVRVIDLCAWSGIIGTAGLLIVRGGPQKILFQPGLFGTIQALSLGSAIGSFIGMGYGTYRTSSFGDKNDEDDD